MTGLTLLASYPKSGNTWLRAVLESLRRGGAPVAINELAQGIANVARRGWFDSFMGVESSDLTPAEIARARPSFHRRLACNTVEPTILKVHDAWQPVEHGGEPPFPADCVAAVLYVVRDPRDVAVSLAHHIGKPIDEAITKMADPKAMASVEKTGLRPQLPQFISSWSAHVESWLDAPALRLHVMRYEDMVAAPERTFADAARFLGLPMTPASLAGAIEATHFDALRTQEERSGFNERPAGMERFFRRGVVGGWRDSLTDAQSERIVSTHRQVMRRLGYLP